MTVKTSPQGELAPLEAVQRPLPGIEVMEWNDTEEDREIGWLLWDKAVDAL